MRHTIGAWRKGPGPGPLNLLCYNSGTGAEPCAGNLERIYIMGDRVLFQMVRGPSEFGPAVYCHWSGGRAPDIVRALASRMKTRTGDLDYATARLVQECIGRGDAGALGFGVWNAPARLTEKDTQGDAGIVLIDCDGFTCECLGGYLVTGPDGFPLSPPCMQ